MILGLIAHNKLFAGLAECYIHPRLVHVPHAIRQVAHAPVKADGRRVYIQHGQPGPGVLRKFFARKIQQLCANAAAAGGLCDKQVADLPRFMADTHHAVRRIRSGVQVECPARLALFFQALAHDFRRIFCKACFGAHIPADGAAAFGKQFCGCIQLGIRLDQLGTLGTLPARDLGDRVGGAPLVIQVRAALAGAIGRELLALCPGFACLDEYRARCFVPGHWVTVCTGTETYAAQALSIDDAGRLVVQREGGRTEALRCGEVTIRPTKTE